MANETQLTFLNYLADQTNTAERENKEAVARQDWDAADAATSRWMERFNIMRSWQDALFPGHDRINGDDIPF